MNPVDHPDHYWTNGNYGGWVNGNADGSERLDTFWYMGHDTENRDDFDKKAQYPFIPSWN